MTIEEDFETLQGTGTIILARESFEGMLKYMDAHKKGKTEFEYNGQRLALQEGLEKIREDYREMLKIRIFPESIMNQFRMIYEKLEERVAELNGGAA